MTLIQEICRKLKISSFRRNNLKILEGFWSFLEPPTEHLFTSTTDSHVLTLWKVFYFAELSGVVELEIIDFLGFLNLWGLQKTSELFRSFQKTSGAFRRLQ